MMKQSYILLFLLLCLSGCTTFVNVHNPSGVTQDALATITAEDVGAWIGDYEIYASITKVFDTEGNTVIKGDFWSGDPEEARLVSGNYQFIVQCQTRGVYNFHRVNIQLERSNEYTLYCLGDYKSWVIGDKITGMLGFISNNKVLEKEREENQSKLSKISEAE